MGKIGVGIKMFECANCGKLEYVWLDGYAFGDKILEDVMFRVYDKDNVIIDEIYDDDYWEGLNKAKWLKDAQESARQCLEDGEGLTCPNCLGEVLKSGIKTKKTISIQGKSLQEILLVIRG